MCYEVDRTARDVASELVDFHSLTFAARKCLQFAGEAVSMHHA